VDLRDAWPSLFIRNYKFWENEWNKHGSCSAFNQYEYFKLGLDIWKEYNLTSILEQDGIVPGYSYPPRKIRRAILKEVGFEPSLICVRSFLTQIQLCLDPLAQSYIPCPNLSTSCNGNLIKFRAWMRSLLKIVLLLDLILVIMAIKKAWTYEFDYMYPLTGNL
jgi:ribonuclease I